MCLSVCMSVCLLMKCVRKTFSAVSGRIFTEFGPKGWIVEDLLMHEFGMERAKVKVIRAKKCLELTLLEEDVLTALSQQLLIIFKICFTVVTVYPVLALRQVLFCLKLFQGHSDLELKIWILF